ncbi:hypothetical protein KFK09_028143 [Dendrobium nobile]|uniref:Autophagy-related protein 13 N-terminal domain-containing protein n=1 Tax=Dendrobium nobile TaxID=94219 RepID=A0A8T3A0V3_DENNO|nr:hypothetical protein KFK09_028143 [Dendrobium nobile]
MPPMMAQHQSEVSRTEQIISQFFLKTLQAVLTSRIPNLSGGGRVRRRDRWFNLAIDDLPPALENLGFWHQGVMEPMIVDVILSPRDGVESVAVIERWIAQCESPPPWGDGATTLPSSSASFYRRTYKKSILLLRSIYSLLRFLPAYRAFRLLSSSNQSSNYNLSYKVSSIAEPFSREEEKGFKQQAFPPVESQLGYLSVSVLYRPTLENFNLEVSSLLPPMIIADYVGSPAADPMRAFPASPSEKGMRPISFPLRGVRPSAAPAFQRPHSWTTTPMAHHPLHASVGAVAEQRVSPPDYFGQRMAAPRQFGHKKGSFSFEEHLLSPPFSASPTPSPPTHAANAFPVRLRSETAPVSIPQSMAGKNHLYRTPNFSDPTRNLLPPPSPSPRSARADVYLEESPSARSFKKLDALKAGDLHSLLYTAPKVLKDPKDDSGRFSSVLSSGGSPRFAFSRSSSRKSLQDDLDDFDFSCPFAVDDVDTSESHSRNHDSKDVSESAQASPHRSQDAAVGVLVHMLRTAPTLRQDHSLSSQSSKSDVNSEASTSSFLSSRKKSDALEELRSYRDMKEILLSKSRSQILDSEKHATK